LKKKTEESESSENAVCWDYEVAEANRIQWGTPSSTA
jgi:hypothetical protein